MMLLFLLIKTVIFALAHYLSRVNPEQLLEISIIIIEQLLNWSKGVKNGLKEKAVRFLLCV